MPNDPMQSISSESYAQNNPAASGNQMGAMQNNPTSNGQGAGGFSNLTSGSAQSQHILSSNPPSQGADTLNPMAAAGGMFGGGAPATETLGARKPEGGARKAM